MKPDDQTQVPPPSSRTPQAIAAQIVTTWLMDSMSATQFERIRQLEAAIASALSEAGNPVDEAELIERLEDWSRVLDQAPAYLAKGQYSRIYEAAFRTAADIRQYVAQLQGQRELAMSDHPASADGNG